MVVGLPGDPFLASIFFIGGLQLHRLHLSPPPNWKRPFRGGGPVTKTNRFFPFFSVASKVESTNDPQETMINVTYDMHPFSMCVLVDFCSPSLGPKCETLGQHIGKSLKWVSAELLDQWITVAFFFVTFLSKSGLGRWLGNHLTRLHPNQVIFWKTSIHIIRSCWFAVHVRFVEVGLFWGGYMYFFPKVLRFIEYS